MKRRTDLALEATQLWQESAEEIGTLSGVELEELMQEGYPVTTVHIRDGAGARALGKSVDTHVTLELDGLARREEDVFGRTAQTLAAELGALLGLALGAPVLMTGLDNRVITPDNVGPEAADQTMMTRHLVERVPKYFGFFRPVVAPAAEVLGTTDIESGELVRAVAEILRPACVIAVNTPASRSLRRICRTIQLTGISITPGSGVGNVRTAPSAETLGVPAIAVDVPAAVDAAILTCDVLAEADKGELNPAALQGAGDDLIVTPKDIDTQVHDLAKVIGYGISLALHTNLTVENVGLFPS